MKGGISETRIEKRIVISGDADIDHDEVRPKVPCSTVSAVTCCTSSVYLNAPPSMYAVEVIMTKLNRLLLK